MNAKEPIHFSDYFNIDKTILNELGVFDPILNFDTKIFVEPLLLKNSANEIIKNSHQTYREFFVGLLLLLKNPFKSEINVGELLKKWLGIIGSGFCLYLYCSLIQNAATVFASMNTYLMTITGVIMGVIFLHETISQQIMIGCTFIFFSLILVNHAPLFEKLFVSISRQISLKMLVNRNW